MATRKIEKAHWKKYFDDASANLGTAQMKLELASPDLGDLTEVDWLPVKGLSYDPREDRLDVITEELDHAVSHPEQIFALEENGVLHALEVMDSDRQNHILQFRKFFRAEDL